MKINEKILSIPPYISTSWKNVQSLSVKDDQSGGLLLLVQLKNAPLPVTIPDLSKAEIDQAFSFHTEFLDEDTLTSPSPFKLGSIGLGSLDQLGSAMQHNPDQMHAKDLPEDFLKKVGSIAKALGLDKPEHFPKPEPHCNCPYCQVAKALHKIDGSSDEEVVSDEDLRFRTWDVEQVGEHLYLVTNPLDKTEEYSVFLGDPIGCTCGEKNCEHIKAVLNS